MEVRISSWTALVLLGSAGLAHGQTWSMLPPPEARSGHAMAYDSGRGSTVMFGAAGNATTPETTWEFRGDRWARVPTAVTPPYRQLTAMAYDSRRGRVVMFGGTGATRLNDTWEYDGTNWTLVSTAARPPARYGHAMAYDPTVGVVVLFGGSGDRYLADTWLYDGTNWTEVTPPNVPSARLGAALSFEPTLGRSLLFGGTYLSRLNDTWTFDAQTRTWTDLQLPTTASPDPRFYHAMAHDPSRGCTLFGGIGSAPFEDTWVFLPTVPTWTRLAPIDSPPARSRHAMVYDPAIGCLLFGGAAPGLSSDTWVFNGTTWVASSIRPVPQQYAGLFSDPLTGRLLLTGGMPSRMSPASLTETWELDGSRWSRIASASPGPSRSWPGRSYDRQRRCVVVFGGAIGPPGNYISTDETWEFDSRNEIWKLRSPLYFPSARTLPGMTYDARRRVSVLFGGSVNQGSTWAGIDDTWEYDGTTWTQVETLRSPSPRATSLAYDARTGLVVMFGGAYLRSNGGYTSLDDTWVYDGADWYEIPIPAQARPPARWTPTLDYDPARGRILMFGGMASAGGYHALDDTWEFDGTSWTQVQVPQRPLARAGAASAHDPVHDRIVVFGGLATSGGFTIAPDILEFRPAPIPAFAPYGFGCSGSNGTPNLDAAPGSLPALGGVLLLDLSQLPTAGGALLLGAGLGIGQFAGMPLPLDLGFAGMPRCDLWIGLDPSISILHGFPSGGTHRISMPIPNLMALDGLQLALQALVVDPGSPNGIATMSNAGIATIH
jgi:hypothetical protein